MPRPPAPQESVEFSGTARFQLLRRLGAGGMGVVYEALDRERNAKVALKTIRSVQPDALLRLKNEFRQLQDLQHPSLVTLGELYSEAGHWFFTMELVDGVDFLSWVRPSPTGEPWHEPDVSPSAETNAPWSDRPAAQRPVIARPPLDLLRLQPALILLAHGLGVLHERGRIHRDIKPSNVLCTTNGRVVLLDFGLAIETGQPGSSDVNVVGTADYMAPEQAASRPVGPAADWYAVGVMLYEALTGRRPFDGSPIEVLLSKQRLSPPTPRSVDPSVPDDLDRLCTSLLRIDPTARPKGPEILQLLGAPLEALSATLAPGPLASAPFLGREKELAALGDAFAETHSGRAVTVLVSGESGVGKSALVRQFAERLRAAHSDAVILAGRCYERESVPYKAFDGVVDSLARHLTKLPKSAAAALLPLRVDLLAQVFPVLARVPAVIEAPSLKSGTPDPQELRARVFAALRELFARLCERHPTALLIDDLQWADADSLTLLNELLLPPDAPPLLIVATARASRESLSGIGGAAFSDARHVHVGRLPLDQARALATLLMERQGGGSLASEDAQAVAKESGGHPLFIDELVRHLIQPSGDTQPGTPVHLDGALWARVRRLDAGALQLLQLCAVAGTPLAEEAAARAMEIDPTTLLRHLALLRASNLVRAGLLQSDAIEPYHDRVREALLANLDEPSQRELHRRLARALAEQPNVDAEVLFTHFRGAGDHAPAAEHAARAADEAFHALAFARAARLYQQSIELAGPGAHPVDRYVRLGEALACIGRSGDAALAYLEAARHAHGEQALELQRRAAEKLLVSGYIDEGIDGLRTVLTAVGLKLADTPRGALFSLALRRLHLRLRGLKFNERSEAEVDPAALRRIDVCWSVAIGLGLVDPIRGMDFQTRHLLLSLAAGEPYRVARALALEGAFMASRGNKGRAPAEKVLDAADALARKLDRPHAIGLAGLARGIAAFLDGRWREAHHRLEEALPILRDQCVNATWEVNTCEQFAMLSLTKLGLLGEAARRMPRLLRSARERGDLYAGALLRSGLMSLVSLASDDPDRTRQEVVEGIGRWSQRGFHLQHYWELLGQASCDLYAGDGRTALARITERWPVMARSQALRIAYLRADAVHLRARARLSTAGRLTQSDPERARLINAALDDADRLERQGGPATHPLSLMLRAGAAAARGQLDTASSLCLEATRAFDAADMALHAAICRQRHGELMGAAGRALIDTSRAYMDAQRIRSPRRMCALFMPGFPD